MPILLLLLLAATGWTPPAPGAGSVSKPDLRPETTAAFEQYVKDVEAEVDARVSGKKNFLWLDDVPERRSRARRGEVVSMRTVGDGPVNVPNGLVHDFIGGVFIPGATLAQTLAFVQDYDHHEDFYGPEVVDAKIRRREGDHVVIFMRLQKGRMGVTAVLDTTHDAQFFQLDPARCYSRSKTTSVKEVQNAGSRDQKVQPEGYGHGFMWALNSYWRFLERDGGTYVECQAVSLSRGLPRLIGFIVGWIVNDLPRESLENTLAATRAGVLRRAGARDPRSSSSEQESM